MSDQPYTGQDQLIYKNNCLWPLAKENHDEPKKKFSNSREGRNVAVAPMGLYNDKMILHLI